MLNFAAGVYNTHWQHQHQQRFGLGRRLGRRAFQHPWQLPCTNFNIISSTISDANSTARSSDTLATAHEFESDTNETTKISANNGWPNTKAYDSTNISAT
jgi:hypothetical protein